MSLLRLAVLGPPEVVHEGSRLTFALRKAQALLLYLAVEGGMHPRGKLAALLWPDREPADARKTLRNAITLLRSLLADADASGAPAGALRSALLLAGGKRRARAGQDHPHALAGARSALGGGLPAFDACAPGAWRCERRLAGLCHLPGAVGRGVAGQTFGGDRGA